jgi:ATP-binding cassette subfamily F protein 3
VLGSFGFPGDSADRLVAQLSGGEATRLALCKALCNPVNLLVLDEPTNHLDLPSCDLLEDALRAYPGTVLLVTHDRHLIRNVAESLVEVRDGRVRLHPGVDEAVLRPGGTGSAPSRPTAEARPVEPSSAARSGGPAPRRDAQRAREARKALARTERRWERAEAEVAALQSRLADPDLYADPDEVQRVVDAHEAAKDLAARLMVEWEDHAAAVEAAS